jgi:mycoredoxin
MKMTEEKIIIVYGTTWCPTSRRTTSFLDDHKIQYRWVDIDRDPEGRAYVEKVNRGNRSVPTILFPDGNILVEPKIDVLAAKLGIDTTFGS